MLAFLLLFSAASAIDSSQRFSFIKQPTIFRQNAEVCRMCYGEYDCLTMARARCEYNAETAAILYDGDKVESKDSALKTQVDTMLNDLMLQESAIEKYEDCIPIISSYSNCNRENICSGCRTCDCTMEGKWNCSAVQLCRPGRIEVDHRALVFVMEKLKSDSEPFRVKREVHFAKSTLKAVNVDDLLNWFYEEATPEQHDAFKNMPHLKEPSTKTKRDSAAPTIIPFDDVLNVIGLDSNDSSTDDVVSLNHSENLDWGKDIDDFLQMLALEEGRETKTPALDATTKLIAIFNGDNNSINVSDTDNLNKKDANEKLNKQVLLENDFNLMDSLGFINLINVMKRDINKVANAVANLTIEARNFSGNLTDKPIIVKNTIDSVNTNLTIIAKSSENDTKHMTDSQRVLRNNVLNALSVLIKNKHKEVKQLNDIKQSLIKFMNTYNFNSTTHYESKFNGSNSHSIFKPEVQLHSYYDFRRSYSNNNTTLVNKYVNKLKLDIHEVIRDILGIRKYQKSTVLSNDLKLLLQAITYYLKRNKDTTAEKIGTLKNLRRQFNPVKIDTNLNPFLTAVIKILELIDKDMPASNALGPLSPRANKALKRIVNRNYIDDFITKEKDIQSNFTVDLNSIGLKWQELTMNIVNCAAADRLHNMKSLYLTLSNDITQLKDMSALTDFFYSRRMSVADDIEQKAIMHRINTDLNQVDNIIRHYKKEIKAIKLKKTKPRLSLFNKIKVLWKTSKNDLITVLHRRSRPHIVKEMERKKMEDEKKRSFLEVMQKWQNNLDIMSSRNKRSIREFTKLKNRMKNIIPHYLRGKLHPALTAKGMGVRKKPITYKMRPKNTGHAAPKMLITSAKPQVRLNKMKHKH